MTNEEVKNIVLDIIVDVAPDEDVADLDPAQSLRDQLDLDSMDFLDIVMELRKRHQVEVPSEDYPKLATLNSCVEYLTPMMQ
jgi:acyl carrier protein